MVFEVPICLSDGSLMKPSTFYRGIYKSGYFVGTSTYFCLGLSCLRVPTFFGIFTGLASGEVYRRGLRRIF